MMTDRLVRALAPLLFALLAATTPARAVEEPFLEWTFEQDRALALELVAATLKLAETLPPVHAELAREEVEEAETTLWPRFGATLAQRDPALADALAAALEDLAEALDTEGIAAPAAARAQRLLDAAREELITDRLRDAPQFTGALLADLLLAEGGVAESYEEAVDEPAAYPGGWAALQRVGALWTDLRPLAEDPQRADADEMIASLERLFLSPAPPASTLGWNPEEAEAPAQRLVGIVEGVVGASLYPGRELQRLAGHLAGKVREACGLYATGDEAIAGERLRAVQRLYQQHLSDTAALFAPTENATAQRSLTRLTGTGDDDEEAPADNAHDPGETLLDGTACGNLAETLLEIGSVFGG